MRSGVLNKVRRFFLGPDRGAECGRGLQSGFGKEALRKRWQAAVGEIEFDALDAMHGEKHYGWGKRFSVSNHHGEVFKGCELGSA